ncbi:MAG: LuxR C-terminal-related transcriptional regulator [Desulfobacteraceae bacterium]|jgi:DNA-binding CsgD family transcriptional regulator
MVQDKSTSEAQQLSQTILNCLSAHVAILDENGFILETNLAWKKFAKQNRLEIRPDSRDVNYLEICDSAGGQTAGESSFVAEGIRDVIKGRSAEFVMEYSCHSPDEKRWFYMRVTRTAVPGPLRIVVSHENITPIKLAEEKLRRSEDALLREKRKLEEANTALKVLLRQREADRRNLEADVVDNLARVVTPVLNRLAKQPLPERSKSLIASLDTRLSQLIKPFLRRMSAIHAALTPQEIEIATLIREGLYSQEIADRLNLSITTVNFHRRNLRRKLGLRNTRKNLRAFLTGLVE